MPPLHLTDAEQLKRLLLDPLIEVLRAEMRQAVRPLVNDLAELRHREKVREQQINQIEQRLSTLERFKLKIAAVCSGVAVAAGVVWRMVLDWIKSHLPRGH
jgi:predicted GTPase